MRLFGWVSNKEHKEILDDWQDAWNRIREKYSELYETHSQTKFENKNLRGKILELENQLKIAQGQAVAQAHAEGKPAPKHVPFPKKTPKPKAVK